MAIGDVLKYKAGLAKGKLATWTCGDASIKAPFLKMVANATKDSGADLSTDAGKKVFISLLKQGTEGKKFLSALDGQNISYADVVDHVVANKVKKGKAGGTGTKNNDKINKTLVKVIATKFPITTNKETVFMSLIEYLENTDNQNTLYSQFTTLSETNGHNDKNMIILRVPKSKKKA